MPLGACVVTARSRWPSALRSAAAITAVSPAGVWTEPLRAKIGAASSVALGSGVWLAGATEADAEADGDAVGPPLHATKRRDADTMADRDQPSLGCPMAIYSSWLVQCGQRVAARGISVKQKGQALVVGSAGGAALAVRAFMAFIAQTVADHYAQRHPPPTGP